MTCVTEQVAGTDPIYTYGTSNIDNGDLTYIAFAGQFTRFGMTHVQNTPLFININVPNEYTVNVQLRVTAGGNNERGMPELTLLIDSKLGRNRSADGSAFEYTLEPA